MRVHELAKELDKTNKEVLDMLKERGIEVKSHMSSLTDEQIQAVKAPKAEPKPVEEPKKVDTPAAEAPAEAPGHRLPGTAPRTHGAPESTGAPAGSRRYSGCLPSGAGNTLSSPGRRRPR